MFKKSCFFTIYLKIISRPNITILLKVDQKLQNHISHNKILMCTKEKLKNTIFIYAVFTFDVVTFNVEGAVNFFDDSPPNDHETECKET